MISYIFKNKTKNILMIIFCIFCILCSDFIREIFVSIVTGTVPAGYALVSGLPYFFVLAYLFTLKMEYKAKNWLFPCAFAIWFLYYAYEFVFDIIFVITQYNYFIVSDIISYASFITALLAYAFCFFGCIDNFKKVKLLKIGAIIKIVTNIFIATVTTIIEYNMLGKKEYFTNMFFEYLYQIYNSTIKTSIKLLAPILFFVGILLLTLNKKSENINITPYVEVRKAKKAAKTVAKQKQQEKQEAQWVESEEIPEGSWRCMACGKILANDIDRCECGYKKK